MPSPRWPLSLCLALLALALPACDEEGGLPPQRTLAAPGPLQAGRAEVRMPAPVGIGTAGYGPFAAPSSPTPFSMLYPGTTRLHGHPSFKAVVLSRGPDHEVIFLRSDTVGVFQQFRRAVALAVEAKLGRSIDDALYFAGTHTHSGPGRIVSAGDVLDLVADKFLPEFYENMVAAAAQAVLDAYADLEPARVGWSMGTCKAGHNDRRCEDGRDYTNDRMPVLAVERDGKIDAVVFAYAAHGTVLGIGDLTLSQDVSGAMEAQVQARFDHPALALFFNSWGADMAPGDDSMPSGTGAAQPAGYDQLLHVGAAVADAVHAALPQVAWEDAPELFAEVHRVKIDRKVLGYPMGFFPFEYGGVYCNGDKALQDCDPATTVTDLDKTCIAFPETAPAPAQTEISVGRIGKLALVSFPGEPGTLLAEKLLAQLLADFSVKDVMFVGYTQDYIGYSILEDDWWQGGYEASGAIWGPKQGEYLLGRARRVSERVLVEGRARGPIEDEPQPLPPFAIGAYEKYQPAMALDAGTIATEVSSAYGQTDVVTFAVHGGDPWLGAPRATLVDVATGTPVKTRAGQPVDSDGYAFWVDLSPTPSYKDAPKATARTFTWTFSMPVSTRTGGVAPKLAGTYKLVVRAPSDTGDKMVESLPFAIAP